MDICKRRQLCKSCLQPIPRVSCKSTYVLKIIPDDYINKWNTLSTDAVNMFKNRVEQNEQVGPVGPTSLGTVIHRD